MHASPPSGGSTSTGVGSVHRGAVDRRAESLKWLEAARVLRTRHTAAEREVEAHGDRCVAVSAELHDTLRASRDAEAQLRRERKEILSRRQHIGNDLSRVRAMLTQRGSPTRQQLDEVQRALTDADTRLAACKHHLLDDLRLLDSEAAELEEDLSATAAEVHLMAQPLPRPASRSASLPRAAGVGGGGGGGGGAAAPQRSDSPVLGVSAPPEVAAYQRFVERHGGRTGGWGDEDHTTFLRVLAETRDPDVVATRLAVLLGTEEGHVVQHLRWHAQHEVLLNSKRAAVARWQQQRAVDSLNAHAASERKEERERAQQQQRQAAQTQASAAKRQGKAAAIQAWKEERHRQQEAATQQMQRAVSQRREKEAEERAKRAQIKAQVAEYRQRVNAEKALKAEQVRGRRSASLQARPSSEALMHLQARDAELTKRRRESILQKDPERKLTHLMLRQKAHAEKIASTRRATPRSFDRLVQQTQASQMRCAASMCDDTETGGGDEVLLRGTNYISPAPLRCTGRAVPAWCGARPVR